VISACPDVQQMILDAVEADMSEFGEG